MISQGKSDKTYPGHYTYMLVISFKQGTTTNMVICLLYPYVFIYFPRYQMYIICFK